MVAWVLTACVMALLGSLLFVPSIRPTLHVGLRAIDNMATAHS